MGNEIKLTRESIDEYFTEWAVEVARVIDKEAERDKWDLFDHISAINFMLVDIKIDVKKLIKQYEKRN